jgi:hypothetical protein
MNYRRRYFFFVEADNPNLGVSKFGMREQCVEAPIGIVDKLIKVLGRSDRSHSALLLVLRTASAGRWQVVGRAGLDLRLTKPGSSERCKTGYGDHPTRSARTMPPR